jgi:DNA-binding MarR family transcriptional regulator
VEPSVVVFQRVVLLAQRLRHLMDRRLAPDALTTAQAMLLSAAERVQPAPPSFSAVAEALAVSHQNVAQLAGTLSRRGFVELSRDPDDRRVRRIQVTPAARAHFAGRDPEDFAFLGQVFSCLTPQEVQTLSDLLGRVLAQVGPDPGQPASSSSRRS